TDLYGPFPALRRTRERLGDWHHDDWGVARGLSPVHPEGMKGAILGRIIMDEEPGSLTDADGTEYDGILADFWAKVGEDRRALIRDLQRRHVPLYGSTQAVKGATRTAEDGHIELWP